MAVVNLWQRHRSADGKTIVVTAGLGFRVHPRRVCIEYLVHGVVVGAPVKLVCAGLHGVIQESAADLPVLGREVTCLDRNFLNRVDARLLLGLSDLVAVGDVLPFNSVRGGVARRAVHSNVGILLHICARDQIHHRLRVADTGAARDGRADSKNRETVHGGRLHVMTQFAAFRLQEGSRFIHSHRLAG